MTAANGTFKNIRVYCEENFSWYLIETFDTMPGLAFVAYWGIVLFGYDTGIAGGIVTASYFQEEFGFIANGKKDQHRIDDLSSNVVAVLQAGAFFGALGSAPMSSRIGRRWTLFFFILIFVIGAVSQSYESCDVLRRLIFLADPVYCCRWEPWHRLRLCWSCCQRRRYRRYISRRASLRFWMFAQECPWSNYWSFPDHGGHRRNVVLLRQLWVWVFICPEYRCSSISDGISIHIPTGSKIWRIPFGFQLVPAGIMALGLLTVKVSLLARSDLILSTMYSHV